MDRKTFFIRSDGDRWLFGSEDTIYEVFESQTLAIKVAVRTLRDREGIELVILNERGNVSMHLLGARSEN